MVISPVDELIEKIPSPFPVVMAYVSASPSASVSLLVLASLIFVTTVELAAFSSNVGCHVIDQWIIVVEVIDVNGDACGVGTCAVARSDRQHMLG